MGVNYTQLEQALRLNFAEPEQKLTLVLDEVFPILISILYCELCRIQKEKQWFG